MGPVHNAQYLGKLPRDCVSVCLLHESFVSDMFSVLLQDNTIHVN